MSSSTESDDAPEPRGGDDEIVPVLAPEGVVARPLAEVAARALSQPRGHFDMSGVVGAAEEVVVADLIESSG